MSNVFTVQVNENWKLFTTMRVPVKSNYHKSRTAYTKPQFCGVQRHNFTEYKDIKFL